MEPEPAQPRWRRFFDSPAAPLALFGVFAVLIVLTIHRFSIWIDESATLEAVGPHSPREISHLTGFDSHPPLWYLVLKPWLSVFGANIMAARSQSAVFMLAGFAVWYRFVRMRFSRPLALLTLALMVTNPMLLHYAVEGRMYAFGLFLTAVTCTLITGRWRWRWVAYWLCAVAMLYTHFFLAFVLVAQFIYLLLARQDHGRSARWIIVYGASIAVTFVPWLPHAFHITSTAVKNGFWIPPVTLATVPAYVSHAFLHRLDADFEGIRVFPALLYFAAWTAALLRAGRARTGPYSLLWSLVAVPFLCLFILSCKPLVPVFHPRYVIFGLPALITLLSAGALGFAGRWRVGVVAVLIVGHFAGIHMLRWRGFNDTRGYWAMNRVVPEISEPIDGELPMVVCAWLFPFFDAKAMLSDDQHVVHLRPAKPSATTFPDALYFDRPDLYITSLSEVHAHHVWLIDELMRVPTDVPPTWKLETTHRRGYVRTRLFTLP